MAQKPLSRRFDNDTDINHAVAERSEQRKQAETNPLICFPARMLAAGGNLVISAAPNFDVPTGKVYNIRSKSGLGGVLEVRDWIENAYWFYLDILEDPMTAVNDELMAADDDDFLINCPKGMSPFGAEYRKWCIGQVMNRKPKAGDSRRLRIATFIVSLLDYEDLYERPPDEIYTYSKWYIIYNSLHRHWRITLSKLLDFAAESKPGSNVEKLLQDIISSQTKHGEQLDVLLNCTDATFKKAENNAKDLRWIKEEEERKKRKRQTTGRKNQRNGVKNGNGRKTDGKLKNQIMTEVRQTMKKNKCSQSNACRLVSEKHLKSDGKTPIHKKRTIENWMSEANGKKKP